MQLTRRVYRARGRGNIVETGNEEEELHGMRKKLREYITEKISEGWTHKEFENDI